MTIGELMDKIREIQELEDLINQQSNSPSFPRAKYEEELDRLRAVNILIDVDDY